MPVDPQIQTLLTLGATLPPLHTPSVEDARAQFAARDVPGLRSRRSHSVVNRDMQGPGGSLGLRIYTPLGEGPFPLMVFFHGSGFVVCSLDTHDGMCRNLCAGTGCVVVSVDYRLAPEAKFPAGTGRLSGGDALGGGERGGAGRRSGPGVGRRATAPGVTSPPSPRCVSVTRAGPNCSVSLLIYPVTDYYRPRDTIDDGERRGLRSDPRRDGVVLEPLSGGPVAWCAPARQPAASRDLDGLPPALVVTAEYDPLRDEGEYYARAPASGRRADGDASAGTG